YADNFPIRRTKKVLNITSPTYPITSIVSDIAVDQNTNVLYVSNYKFNKIQAYDTAGGLLFEFGGEDEDSTLKYIMGLWVDSSGKIFVVSQGNNKVCVFNPQGNLLLKFPTEHNAYDVITNSFGDILISINDTGKSRILIYDNEGKYKFAIRKVTTGDGKKFDLGSPTWLGITTDDNLFVVDKIPCKVYIFDAKGRLTKSFGGRGDTAGSFFSMGGISVDNKNRVYVADYTRGIVQIFTKDGEFIAAVSDEKGNRTALSMTKGIALDSNNRLYCLEPVDARISVFSFLDK
ncbi:NHL repeat-containing protein, partial [Candidatus Desantisbacteria bacterium]|nr:NHL repeat-containing protein [Candidatus Desantisbacteria bacterium]